MNNFSASAIEDCNALMKSVEPERNHENAWYQNTEVVTAWIDETHAIVNHRMINDTARDSRIANFQTKTLEPYIYGDDMSNYSSGRRMCEQPQKVDLGRKFTLFSPHSPKSYTRLIAWK